MLVNDDFLFLHYPKTAGKSLTKYFVNAWNGPIYGRVSQGQMKELADVLRQDVSLEIGKGHENMRNARDILEDRGQRIQDMRAVFVCIRNPYDIAVSTYHFMRERYMNNRQIPRFLLANERCFEDFWCNDESVGRPESWLTLDEKKPGNQRLIRFEHLREDLGIVSREFEFREATLPHMNASNHDHYSEYITPRSEEAIFEKFRYLFESGCYSRESFG